MRNLSQIKRDRMLQFLERIKKEHEDDESLIAISEIENALTEKKYGLVWEEHEEEVDVKIKTHVPVFIDVTDMEIKGNCSDENYNFLLEGDNLHSLKLLEKTHRGKIDVIYIDPPYNTGNKDFRYDDEFINSEDYFSHSKWLSFMNERLILAKSLLKPNGIIFLSIDKNEGFQLKLLLDEIFGEESCVADLHVETSIIGGPRRIPAMKGSVVKTTEFVFGYVNGTNTQIMKNPMFDYISGFDTHYSLFYDKSVGHVVNFNEYIKNIVEIKECFEKAELKVSLQNLSKLIGVNNTITQWLYSDEIASNLYRKGDAVTLSASVTKLHNRNSVFEIDDQYIYLDENGKTYGLFRYKDRLGYCDDYFNHYGERSIRGNLWKGFSADGGNLAKEGGVAFKNGKKPKRLLKQLIYSVLGDKREAWILDFFAGSGSTAEAVLELNRDKGLGLKFILCTNNENNICQDVTYQRLKTVITGVKQDGKEYSYGIPANVKYYKTDFVAKANDDEYYFVSEELQKHIKEMVQLEKGISIQDDNYILLLSDDEADELEKNPSRLDKCNGIYISSGVFLTDTQEKMLKDIPIETIPDYFFESELREVGEL